MKCGCQQKTYFWCRTKRAYFNCMVVVMNLIEHEKVWFCFYQLLFTWSTVFIERYCMCLMSGCYVSEECLLLLWVLLTPWLTPEHLSSAQLSWETLGREMWCNKHHCYLQHNIDKSAHCVDTRWADLRVERNIVQDHCTCYQVRSKDHLMIAMLWQCGHLLRSPPGQYHVSGLSAIMFRLVDSLSAL